MEKLIKYRCSRHLTIHGPLAFPYNASVSIHVACIRRREIPLEWFYSDFLAEQEENELLSPGDIKLTSDSFNVLYSPDE